MKRIITPKRAIAWIAFATVMILLIHKGWALDGKPTPGPMRLEFEID